MMVDLVGVCVCACVWFRMRCADIQAARDPEEQWISAKAVFNASVTGAVTLVRT